MYVHIVEGTPAFVKGNHVATATSSWSASRPEVHHRLAAEAAEEDIGLNRLVSAKLSS